MEDVLREKKYPNELINLSHFLRVNISSDFTENEKKDLDFLLWTWNENNKKIFYAYLHQLNQIFNEDLDKGTSSLKKRFRIKE